MARRVIGGSETDRQLCRPTTTRHCADQGWEKTSFFLEKKSL